MDRQKTSQFLTFLMGNEVYALEVTCTREVIPFSSLTPIPKTPEWIRGVLNLRGTVVPVLDLKHRLGMGSTERGKRACILILEIVLDEVLTVVGVLADAVREVLEIPASEIEPPPRFGSRVSTAFLRGMGRRNDSLFVILDVNKIFATGDVELAEEMVRAEPEVVTPPEMATSTAEVPEGSAPAP